jgi:hypothetical protein
MAQQFPTAELRTVLDSLEAEQQRRLEAKIDAGEVVAYDHVIIVGTEAALARAVARVEQSRRTPARAPDGREIHFDPRRIAIVMTGVPRPGDDEDDPPALQPSATAGPSNGGGESISRKPLPIAYEEPDEAESGCGVPGFP